MWIDYLPHAAASLALIGGFIQAWDAWADRSPTETFAGAAVWTCLKLALAPLQAVFLFVVVSFGLTMWRGSSPVNPKTWMVGDGGTVACRSRDTMERLGQLVRDGDHKAFRQLASTTTSSGQCSEIVSGTQVAVVHREFLSGFAKVRPFGQLDEFWTVDKALVEKRN